MRDPELASDRAKSDVIDCEDIKRIYKASGQRYGVRKVWHALRREGNDIARCTVERRLSGHCFAMPCRAMDESLGSTGRCAG